MAGGQPFYEQIKEICMLILIHNSQFRFRVFIPFSYHSDSSSPKGRAFTFSWLDSR